MKLELNQQIRLKQGEGCFIGSFQAMNCPCEILVDTEDGKLAEAITAEAADEAWRIENKFSRYLSDSAVSAINQSNGRPVQVDEETALLLDFADQAFRLSEGMFDISSGVLRRAWTFDGKEHQAPLKQIRALLPQVGWQRVTWKRPFISLPPQMEIDLGGIGKEYAVDRTLALLRQRSGVGLLVNFGGDLAVGGTRRNNLPWTIGVEKPGQDKSAVHIIHVKKGGVATSGDSRKFLILDGERRGHILNPKTGFPIKDAPRSVTVAAGSCTEAGFYSTLTILQGQDAEKFVREEGLKAWICR